MVWTPKAQIALANDPTTAEILADPTTLSHGVLQGMASELVTQGLADDPALAAGVQTLVDDAVAAVDVVLRSDPGIPLLKNSGIQTATGDPLEEATLDDRDALYEGRYGRTKYFPAVRGDEVLVGAKITQADQSYQDTVRGTLMVDGAGVERWAEDRLNAQGNVPSSTLERWKVRGGFGGSTLSSAAPIDLVIVAGQSNAGQRLDYYPVMEPPHPGVCRWDVDALVWGVSDGAPWIGSGFAREYALHVANPQGRRVGIVRTSMGESGFSNNTRCWDRTNTSATLNLALQARDRAVAALAAAPAGSRIVAIIWSQGEEDRSMTASAYEAKLDDFIGWIRTVLSSPDLPFILSSFTPEIIAWGGAGGAVIQGVVEDTPRRILHTSYIQGPAGYAEIIDGAGSGIHWRPMAHSARGRDMADRGMPLALCNEVVADPEMPARIRISRSGGEAVIEWDHPVSRVLSYTLETSVNSGSTWTTETLPATLTHRFTKTVAAGTALWVRMSSTNEEGQSLTTLPVKG